MEDSRKLYLELMKKCLMNTIYGDKEVVPVSPGGPVRQAILQPLHRRGIYLVRPKQFDLNVRSEGRDWPTYGQTMVSAKRLDNVQYCVEQVIANHIPGDLIETGVWRGGTAIFMRAILKAHGVHNCTIWAADSFEGLPPPDTEKYPIDAAIAYHTMKELVVPLEEVKANFARYGLLDDQVCFLKGWFRDTLPTAPIERLAVMRLDGDMYESTLDALTNLYPKLSIGGYVIIDDYGGLPACRQAVHDYREQHSIQEEITQVDFTGVYWQRSR